MFICVDSNWAFRSRKDNPNFPLDPSSLPSRWPQADKRFVNRIDVNLQGQM